MTFKPAIWRPIALVLSVVNLIAMGFAAGDAEPWHAAIHAALAAAFGLWAQRLREQPGGGAVQARLDSLEGDVDRLRQDLTETQERLDFAERLLAKLPDATRVGPQR